VTVTVNGQPREVAHDCTLAELLEALGYRAEGVAVAVDRQVVPRSELAHRRVRPGAEVEVLRAVGGG
jgi:thiamine biosynthesis protein ThiS